MNPVLMNLKRRRHKKIPIRDGRKIALVNFGGFMTGVYSAGAMLALVEIGYENSFDEIYTISSGFHNACSFLSGDGRRNTSVYYEELCKGDFFKPRRFWKIIDVEHLANILKNKKPINVDRLLKQPTKLFVRLRNTNANKEEYIEVHSLGKNNFFKLIRAAAAVPFLSQTKIKLGQHEYRDPIWFDQQMSAHLSHVAQTDATDIAVIYNQYLQYTYIKSRFQRLASPRFLHIYPKKEWILSRFENNPEILKNAAKQMGRKVYGLFGLKKGITLFESDLYLN